MSTVLNSFNRPMTGDKLDAPLHKKSKHPQGGTFFTFFVKKRATFDPKKRVEFEDNLGFFSKNVALFLSGVDNSPVGTTTSGISRLF